MNSQNLELILKKTQLGAEFKEEELKKLANVAKLQEFKSGTFLIKEGSSSDSLMIVIEGKIEVETQNSQHYIAEIEATPKGLVIGELGLLLDEPRAASIKALQDCQALVFDKASLSQFLLNGDSLITTLAIQLGQSLAMKVKILLEEVVTLFNKQDQLLTSIESLSHFPSQTNLKALKEDLLKEAETLRESQQKVEKKLYYLDTQIKHRNKTTQIAQLLIALVTGSLFTLIIIWITNLAIAKFDPSNSLDSDITPYPTVVPYIDTPEACAERGGSRWQNNQCWDYQHDPKW